MAQTDFAVPLSHFLKKHQEILGSIPEILVHQNQIRELGEASATTGARGASDTNILVQIFANRRTANEKAQYEFLLRQAAGQTRLLRRRLTEFLELYRTLDGLLKKKNPARMEQLLTNPNSWRKNILLIVSERRKIEERFVGLNRSLQPLGLQLSSSTLQIIDSRRGK